MEEITRWTVGDPGAMPGKRRSTAIPGVDVVIVCFLTVGREILCPSNAKPSWHIRIP